MRKFAACGAACSRGRRPYNRPIALAEAASGHAPTCQAVSTALTENVERWVDRNHFLIRRLHSLTGIVPVGVFLIEHLFTNSLTLLSAAKFNEHVHWLHRLPYLPVIELLFIFLPLAFHAGYGVVIARTGRSNVEQYPWLDNWRYTLQRVTGWIALGFILVHLAHFRFAHWFGGPTYVGAPDPFGLTQLGFNQVLPSGVWITLYLVGLLSAVFHFCNGICTFCITWGITVGDRSRKRVSIGAAGLGMVLAAWGIASLIGLRMNFSPGEIEHRQVAERSHVRLDDAGTAAPGRTPDGGF